MHTPFCREGDIMEKPMMTVLSRNASEGMAPSAGCRGRGECRMVRRGAEGEKAISQTTRVHWSR
jgi:hypothetical protein